jgi:tRNA threonylcarbamoyl adenosine modification protein YeaZ
VSGPPDRRTTILAIDSATTRVVVALGTRTGALIEATDWPAGYRHGETLLPAIASLLDRLEIARSSLAAVVVGTGPGAFTGLRVGLATAKGLAHALAAPIIGISTAVALLDGAPAGTVLLLPAGPADRIVVRRGDPARLQPAGEDLPTTDDGMLVAVDLDGRAPAGALERGETARARLGAALIALGAARLAAGDVDDLARLVPEYVTLPRGVTGTSGEVSWSRDLR